VRWLGRCPECQSWNTFFEEAAAERRVGAPPRPASAGSGVARSLAELEATPETRFSTGIAELDLVLGGGLVVGSVVLIGGEPGIGKTTLLLSALAGLHDRGKRVMYVSGEESALQIKLRAERIGAVRPGLLLLTENCLETMEAEVRNRKPEVLVLDSVQSTYSVYSPSPPGTVAQVRESAARLISLAKGEGITTFLVGHVTKEGSLAGPKVLEHMVDTVLYFENDTGQLCRIIRASKNRFGSTNEVGIFRMGDGGLEPVQNPSTFFLGLHRSPLPGTAIVPILEGRRPILVEVQALVSPTAYSTGRRSVTGLDLNRVVMLLAVLEKRGGLVFGSADVYVNVSGGFRIVEPAADLAVLAALVSGHRNTPVPPSTAFIGEVSLTGEVRGVSGMDTRVRELARLGFSRVVTPPSPREAHREGTGDAPATVIHSVDEIFPLIVS
jgi:DNA repair protein RadA/Sms